MDHRSTEWKDRLLKAQKDLTVGIKQEDPAQRPIFESELEPELGIELSSSGLNSKPGSSSELELGLERELGIELSSSGFNFSDLELEPEPELERELGIELSGSGLNSEPSSSSELNLELERELYSKLQRGNRARVPAQPRTELRVDPIIEKATVATQKARVSMMRKYTKKHDIQHFNIGAVVSLKIPQEDRTLTDNKRVFARILEEPYPYRYRVLTLSSVIQRLIPTKSLGAIEKAL
ncbi:hypothetical protein V496_01394 [Pseudogymnoascus sp. VKM F-4515 (FW-2607)]|nr:hypothetical protein V496_01394 [Pseudogymnoascus sp. VKM F-4515 (FW-2607)]